MRKPVRVYGNQVWMPRNNGRRRGFDGTMPIYGSNRGKVETKMAIAEGFVKRVYRKPKEKRVTPVSDLSFYQKLLSLIWGAK